MNMELLVKAIKEALKSKKRRFTEAVDLIITLEGLDLRQPKNRIKAKITLPHIVRRNAKICVIASGDLLLKAKEMNLRVIDKEELESLAKNKKLAKKLAKEYDLFIAKADMMPLVGRALGPILAPRKKMPQPVPLNVDLSKLIERLQKTVNIDVSKNPMVQLRIGDEDTPVEELAENALAVIKFINEKLEALGVGRIKKIYVKKTMGKCIEVSERGKQKR